VIGGVSVLAIIVSGIVLRGEKPYENQPRADGDQNHDQNQPRDALLLGSMPHQNEEKVETNSWIDIHNAFHDKEDKSIDSLKNPPIDANHVLLCRHDLPGVMERCIIKERSQLNDINEMYVILQCCKHQKAIVANIVERAFYKDCKKTFQLNECNTTDCPADVLPMKVARIEAFNRIVMDEVECKTARKVCISGLPGNGRLVAPVHERHATRTDSKSGLYPAQDCRVERKPS
jgi:hypothetical protein